MNLPMEGYSNACVLLHKILESSPISFLPRFREGGEKGSPYKREPVASEKLRPSCSSLLLSFVAASTQAWMKPKIVRATRTADNNDLLSNQLSLAQAHIQSPNHE